MYSTTVIAPGTFTLNPSYGYVSGASYCVDDSNSDVKKLKEKANEQRQATLDLLDDIIRVRKQLRALVVFVWNERVELYLGWYGIHSDLMSVIIRYVGADVSDMNPDSLTICSSVSRKKKSRHKLKKKYGHV